MAVPRQLKTLLLVCAFLVALAALTQPPHSAAGRPAQQPAAEQPRTIYVTVSMEGGQILGGLGPEAFGVFDGEAKARVVSFGGADVPTTIGLVLDASGSMQVNQRVSLFAKMRGALLSFFLSAKSTDEFFLVAFNQQPQLLLRDTSDPAAIINAFDRLAATKPYGQTALYDALYLALNHASNGRHRKRALVVVTDGRDSVSKFSADEVKRAVREGDVSLYIVNFAPNEFRVAHYDEKVLEELCALSGGKLFRPMNEKQLEDSMKRIALELRSQYAIDIAPAPPTRKDGWHDIKIKMANGRAPDGKLYKLYARTRKGFYWPEKGN